MIKIIYGETMRRNAYEAIAQDLEKSILHDPHFILPPINELAAKYEVSYPTMWKAVQVLVKKELIATLPGRAIRVADGVDAAASSKPTPAERIFNTIRGRIIGGAYQAGRHFPKVGYFAASEGVSSLTVLRAFLRLAHENLAHKSNNRWIVGPAPRVLAKKAFTANEAPVILVASESPQTFTTGYTDPFSQRFTAPFVDECMLHGISLRPALLAGTREETPGIPVGVDEARAAIRRLGSRYQGTLVLSAFPRESGVDRWVEAINRFSKPVVFFDQTDKGGFLSRKGLSIRKGFFRLHLDDRAGVRVVLQGLRKAGHTTIGLHGGELYDWSRKRMELIRECAKEFTPALTIAEAGPVEPVWKMYERKFRYASIVTLIQEQMRDHQKPDSTASGMHRELVRATPSLAKLLSEQHPTALIVMNDEIARDYVFWLQAAGIAVPRDLSLIAFDNTPTNLLVSSVDWGFSRLGYLAAHIFIRDVPLHADRDGNIPGICSLVDRGSMGAPRRARR